MISENLKLMDADGRITIRNWDISSQHEPIARPSDSPGTRGNASEYQTKFLKMSAYQDGSSPITESNPDMYPINFAWVPQSEFSPSTKSSAMKTSVNLETTNILPMSDNPSPTSQLQNKAAAKARKNQPSAKKNKPTTPKALKTKPPKQPSTPKKEKNSSKYVGRREKRNLEEVAEGFTYDFSGVPSPVCSCTGILRQCYRWGAGGWQSSCCTTAISLYPLPMSTARPGSRLAGRKMSNGAYRKLLRRLAVEGQDLTNAVDLKDHWARHGTNKFVTIK